MEEKAKLLFQTVSITHNALYFFRYPLQMCANMCEPSAIFF